MEICDIGTKSYTDALGFQLEMLAKRIDKEITDTLIIVEHPPVVTLGRRSLEKNIIDRRYFEQNDIPIILTGRGGEVTYHCPGQIVCYPIFDLRFMGRDISGYIDLLESVVSLAFNQIGVDASRSDGKRGVWVKEKKIAFIGIAVKKWITYHGVAININNDLEGFSKIHPCGHKEIEVTSARDELKNKVNVEVFKKILAYQFVSNVTHANMDQKSQ